MRTIKNINLEGLKMKAKIIIIITMLLAIVAFNCFAESKKVYCHEIINLDNKNVSSEYLVFEDELLMEDWMMLLNYCENIIMIEEESELEIEDWMIDGNENSLLYIVPEEELAIEDWMTEFSQAYNEPDLEIENWMISL